MNTLVYSEQEVDVAVSFVRKNLVIQADGATVLCLQGDLGAGKTTLTKALLKEYGVEGDVQSPTFVLAKWYTPKTEFKKIVHIDAYRIEDIQELGAIRFDELLQETQTLIIIEWPELIAQAIPQEHNWFVLTHIDEDTRTITQKND